MIYNSLIGVNGSYVDNLLREQDYYVPAYVDTLNHFWVYKLDTPVVLPAGTFYAGTMQPAYSNSDSLYYGYDVNRLGGNHTYYRVAGAGQVWNPSLYSGSVMIRPILGHDITSSKVTEGASASRFAHLFPNPSADKVMVNFNTPGIADYALWTMDGRLALKGKVSSGSTLNISDLAPGVYIFTLYGPDGETHFDKLIIQ
jgi:hypothetical protein